MKQFITGEDIERMHLQGKREITVGTEDVVTGIAREQADLLGIEIKQTNAQSMMQQEPRFQGQIESSGAAAFVPEFAGAALRGGSRQGVSVNPASADQPPYDIEMWRKKFPILKEYIHVANCSQAPQSDYTRDAAEAYLESWNSMGMDWMRWIEEVNLAKAEFAKLINAKQSEIAIGTSVSELTSTFASSLVYSGKRNKVVVTDAEFPTVGNVWMGHKKFGAEVQFISLKNGEIDPEDYERFVDDTTLATSICDVFYYNGFKQNLETIIPKIHAKGSLVYLDAYQGLGTHPIDVKALDVDVLVSGNLKYLCGVPGVAFMYVKPELTPHLKPAYTGWFGQENPFAFEIRKLNYAKDARRFDNGTPPIMTAYIARAGMQLINDVGVENIQHWTDRLSAYCIAGALDRGLEVASPQDVRKKSPTTAIRVPGDSHHVEHALKERKIIASARADVVRIAPHFFTKMEDIDYVLDSFAEVLKL